MTAKAVEVQGRRPSKGKQLDFLGNGTEIRGARKRITIDLTPEEHRSLKLRCALNDESIQDIGRRIIRKWLEKEPE